MQSEQHPISHCSHCSLCTFFVMVHEDGDNRVDFISGFEKSVQYAQCEQSDYILAIHEVVYKPELAVTPPSPFPLVCYNPHNHHEHMGGVCFIYNRTYTPHMRYYKSIISWLLGGSHILLLNTCFFLFFLFS